MKKFSAVIFDLDGVIVDSEPLHQKAFEDLFAELGRKHDHGIVFSEHVGLSDHSTLRAFLQKTGLQHELEDLNKRKLTYFLRYLREHRPIFKGLHDLIPELAKHYQLGVATRVCRVTPIIYKRAVDHPYLPKSPQRRMQ